MSLDFYYSGKYVQIEVAFGDRCGTQLFARLRWVCPWCRKAQEWETTDHKVLKELTRWCEAEDDGDRLGNIQDEMPSMPAEIREVFLSGVCPECWNRAFPPSSSEEEEEEDDLPW